MNITVIGAAGRMGRRLVANILESEDLRLIGAVDAPDSPFSGRDAGELAGCGVTGVRVSGRLESALANCDGVVDFSTGDVLEHARMAVEHRCAVVIGSTTLSAADRKTLADLCSHGGRIVFSPNMSIGVNVLFNLVERTTKILGDDYDIEIVEMHHNQKKDAPSGTANRLAEIVCEAAGRSFEQDIVNGRSGVVGARTRREIGMHALRGGDVVGDHTVLFATSGERIELTHKASSRDTFAKGALRAIRFLRHAAPGLYDMQDVLGLR